MAPKLGSKRVKKSDAKKGLVLRRLGGGWARPLVRSLWAGSDKGETAFHLPPRLCSLCVVFAGLSSSCLVVLRVFLATSDVPCTTYELLTDFECMLKQAGVIEAGLIL